MVHPSTSCLPFRVITATHKAVCLCLWSWCWSYHKTKGQDWTWILIADKSVLRENELQVSGEFCGGKKEKSHSSALVMTEKWCWCLYKFQQTKYTMIIFILYYSGSFFLFLLAAFFTRCPSVTGHQQTGYRIVNSTST